MKHLTRVLVLSLIAVFSSNAAFAQAFPVGHTTLTFTDPARNNRAVGCEVYYPAVLAGSDQPVFAPNGTERYPVVVFGHGFLMNVSSYEYLQTALAQAGFIAVFPTTESGFAPSHTEFARDLAFAALSMLDQGNSAASLFHQRVENSMGVMGHSMGGGAAVLSYQYNNAFRTVFTLAAAETSPSAVSAATGIDRPVLYMVGGNDCITPLATHQLPMYNAGSHCHFLVNIDQGTHCRFAGSSFTCSTGESLSGCADGLDETVQQDLVLQWLMPWLDLHLRDNQAAKAVIENLAQGQAGVSVLDACSTLNVEMQRETGFNVIPNADGSLRVTLTNPLLLNTTFQLLGIDGKIIHSGLFDHYDNTVQTNSLSNGVYILRAAASYAAHKIVVAR